jgi:hypothetical protein
MNRPVVGLYWRAPRWISPVGSVVALTATWAVFWSSLVSQDRVPGLVREAMVVSPQV